MPGEQRDGHAEGTSASKVQAVSSVSNTVCDMSRTESQPIDGMSSRAAADPIAAHGCNPRRNPVRQTTQ